jgi:hypothetical protein
MDGASRLFCGSKVGKAQHAHENASTKMRFKQRCRVDKATGSRECAPDDAVPTIQIVMALRQFGGHGARAPLPILRTYFGVQGW